MRKLELILISFVGGLLIFVTTQMLFCDKADIPKTMPKEIKPKPPQHKIVKMLEVPPSVVKEAASKNLGLKMILIAYKEEDKK